MDRYWFLTNTCYGTWLPGSEKGFVGRVWEHRPDDPADQRRVAHALPGTPYDEDIPGIEQESRSLLRGSPICLNLAQAEVLLTQFQETARFRGWGLRAVSIMFNHFHIVVGVNGDPEPAKVLGDFKSWATRRLSERFGPPASGTWWTERGSKRKLGDQGAILATVHYTLYEQYNPLLTWSPETGLHHGPPPQ